MILPKLRQNNKKKIAHEYITIVSSYNKFINKKLNKNQIQLRKERNIERRKNEIKEIEGLENEFLQTFINLE